MRFHSGRGSNRFRTGGPVRVFILDADQLHNIQQVVQGIGAIPEFVLAPEPGGDRQKGELIQIDRLGGQVTGRAGGEVDPFSTKKPSSVQTISFRVRERAPAGSYWRSDQDHSPSCMTG